VARVANGKSRPAPVKRTGSERLGDEFIDPHLRGLLFESADLDFDQQQVVSADDAWKSQMIETSRESANWEEAATALGQRRSLSSGSALEFGARD
jgi:hypothetical protein